ncbi:MAG: bifunctional DedA family/phosphatase PAP2 family protein [Acidimicrobiales bacterium]
MAHWILALHGWAALAVVFALPALESSAFVGFIFPGEIGVLLGGVLAYQHKVNLVAVLAAGVAGAVVGDSVGYAVGHRVGRRLLDATVGRLVKRDHLDRAERYLAERGGKAVFFGRFTAALRVLIPGLAGMAGMPYATFFRYNVAGGTLWAAGFVLLGYGAGSSYRRVEHVAKQASLLLLLLLVVIVAVVVVARRVARNPEGARSAGRRLARWRPVAALIRWGRGLFEAAEGRLRYRGAVGLGLVLSLVALVLLGAAFGLVVRAVVGEQHGHHLIAVDRPVLDFFVRHRRPWLNTVVRVVTTLGGSAVIIPLLAVVAAVARWRRHTWRPLLVFAGAHGGAALLARVVKALVGRPRPPARLAVEHFGGSSFPSGHATQVVAAWGALAFVLAVGASWPRRVALWSAAVLVGLVVGISRLYLGAHWLSDVVGGWALGAVWLLLVLLVAHAAPDRATPEAGGRPPGQTPEGSGQRPGQEPQTSGQRPGHRAEGGAGAATSLT